MKLSDDGHKSGLGDFNIGGILGREANILCHYLCSAAS
jgi:hypothetical protein